jgi:hypothetical protein
MKSKNPMVNAILNGADVKSVLEGKTSTSKLNLYEASDVANKLYSYDTTDIQSVDVTISIPVVPAMKGPGPWGDGDRSPRATIPIGKIAAALEKVLGLRGITVSAIENDLIIKLPEPDIAGVDL